MEKFKKIVTPKRIMFILIFAFVIIFAFQNLKPATIHLIFFSVNIPVLFLILGLYFIGIVTGWAFKRNDMKKIVTEAQTEAKNEINQLKKEIK